MKVPLLARYNGSVAKAYEFIENNIIEFPIQPLELIKKFKWGLLTYEEMALKENCSIEDICECLGTDGYSIYNGSNYTIAYNNTIKSQGRINFTLAHEIGHIILNHHRDFDVTSILEDNFTKAEYKILENEANCFARNILAPAPLVSELNFLNMIFEIPNLFAITLPATTARISFLKNDLYYLTEEQILQFLLKYKRYKQCHNCSTKYLNINTNYCPLCGNKNLILGDGFTMKEYFGTNIESAKECPRCENYNIHPSEDKYCEICGLKLQNECTECRKELNSSARFCTECGAISTYYQEDILDDWNITSKVRTVNQTSSNSDMDFVITNADDLPF